MQNAAENTTTEPEDLYYENILRDCIIKQITMDLTIGREDNDLVSYTKEEIDRYIQENNANIELCIKEMIHDYKEDDELEELEDPLPDWITEYLYQYVNCNDF